MTTQAFNEFERTLADLRSMIEGAQSLERLQVGSFDISDIYRHAWVGAVSALDHWVGEEIQERAVKLFVKPGEKPNRLKKFEITVERFERVHHRSESAEAVFREQLKETLGSTSYQNPDKIKDGFKLVTDVQLWPRVSARLNEARDEPVDVTDLVESLRAITLRRNQIAHETDRDPSAPNGKRPITAESAKAVINQLSEVGEAILHVLDGDSGHGTGNAYLLVLADGESVRWVLGASRMAFNPRIRKRAEELAVGDTLYLVTTKECWGSSSDATTLVVGTATVRTPVRYLEEHERHHETSLYTLGCDLELRSLAPFRQGVELSKLVPSLTAFPNKQQWGWPLRKTLVTLSAEDIEVVQEKLIKIVGDPADYAGDYVNWQRAIQ
ncbi:hypothetical protein Srot_1736 [Segniliparus rotundus DSM 44985]|uniref:RiboL-PSP-HEPN domain-containing protein n=1 Tax=Segniliparus rotundus (strain ATCC BAA-972 / CDC 1076 / CIP 108378 / DSM 44985 / JCM 13578) TaxID=640132 RepID=D6Z8B6_SEGRD|nr:hypothetical protein [Segniliparus rotundus]ADG98196.1 hypothetical protein Srot_1736 [Segniliparus rotundus DSM 44985]